MRKYCLFAAVLALHAAFAWETSRHVDEMTDEVRYIVATTGTVVRTGSILAYSPSLSIRMTPIKYDQKKGKLYYTYDIILSTNESFPTDGPVLALRLDEDKPVVQEWTISTNRRSAFSPKKSDLLSMMQKRKTLRVRYGTIFGEIRNTTFDISGLAEAISGVKALVAAGQKL